MPLPIGFVPEGAPKPTKPVVPAAVKAAHVVLPKDAIKRAFKWVALGLLVLAVGFGGYAVGHWRLGPGPEPTPIPTPDPKGPLRVILVKDADANMTKDQRDALDSSEVAKWLNEHCGKNGWRQWDKDVNVTNAPEEWRQRWAATKPSLGTLPEVVIFHGEKGKPYQIESEEQLLETLKEHEGKR